MKTLTYHIIVLFSFCFLFESISSAQIKTVDLGLSVKWASCNVGAKSPEELGSKFSWGSSTPYDKTKDKNDSQDGRYKFFAIENPGTSTKERLEQAGKAMALTTAGGVSDQVKNKIENSDAEFDWISIALKAVIEGAFVVIFDGEKVKFTITKYNNNSKFGKVDNKNSLDLTDDAAYRKLGASWRMPTKAEAEELIKKCDWTYTSLNGVKGFDVKGPNGNSIFIPLESSINLNILATDYWTKSLCDDPSDAWSFSLSRPWKRTSKSNRARYYFIRPVRR